jgi:hypothetical protein
VAALPIYPEQRQRRRPTTEQILRLFSLTEYEDNQAEEEKHDRH